MAVYRLARPVCEAGESNPGKPARPHGTTRMD